ncbi:MAG: hypothetical protein K0M63_01090 [Weeksellaceae bacterium]|nr:hypothetical protein [Weeksellaceae bacterium]
MNTYRLVKIEAFPNMEVGTGCTKHYNLTIPGFTEDKQTKLTHIATAYHGFEYYEIEHEMVIKDTGLAFGFVDGQPIKMELNGYKKNFTIKFYINHEKQYGFLCENSLVIKDLIRTLKRDTSLGVKLKEVELNFNELHKYIEQYIGAWFRGVSSRVTSSAVFGADLENEPLFNQLRNDGADLSSIIIPYKGMNIQLSKSGGISSNQSLNDIKAELALIQKIKEEIIDPVLLQ